MVYIRIRDFISVIFVKRYQYLIIYINNYLFKFINKNKLIYKSSIIISIKTYIISVRVYST